MNCNRYAYDDIRRTLLQTVNLKKAFALLEVRNHWQHQLNTDFMVINRSVSMSL